MAELLDPWRLGLQKEIGNILREIHPDLGYHNDLTGAEGTPHDAVFRGRVEFSANDPLPMISILEDYREDKNELSPTNNKSTLKYNYRLMIQGWAQDDRRNPTDPAHNLMADVKKRLSLIQESRQNNHFILEFRPKGGRVEDIRVAPGKVRPPEEDSSRAMFWLPVTMKVIEFPLHPYDT